MLHKIVIENYRSFGEKAEISLYPNPKRTLFQNHIYSNDDLLRPVLKHCLIIGPNASGKTNIVTAMKFLREFCSEPTHYYLQDGKLSNWYNENRFHLSIENNDKPIHLGIEFSNHGNYYDYNLYIDRNGFKEESLNLIRGNRLRPVSIFVHTKDHFENTERPDTINIQSWICNSLEVICESPSVHALTDFYQSTPAAIQFTNNALQHIGTEITISINIGKLVFTHTGTDSCLFNSISDESTGTIRLLSLLAILYRAINEDKTFIIDDIEQNINTATFRDLVKFFCESVSKGQLIYTTNSLMTMNQQEMTRLDEVNLLEKKNGSTHVIALDKLPNIKTLLSLERNYLDDRFGGRPGIISLE